MAATDSLQWEQSKQVSTNLIVKLNGGTTEGTNQFTYNGSTAKSINITASSVGAAASNHTHNYAAASHNHSAANITSGTLPIARGGTGITSNPSLLVNLGSTSAASVFTTSPRPGVTGTLSVAHGGTGATTALAANYNIFNSALTQNAGWSDNTTLAYFTGAPSTTQGAIKKYKSLDMWNDWLQGKVLNVAAAKSHGTHVTYSTSAPKPLGQASAGTATTVARSDHVHPLEKKTKRFVLIADSLGVGLGSNPQRGWTYYFKQELGLSDTDCYIAQTSGYGFVANNYGFKRLLQGVSVSDPNSITDVICLGGLNDTNVSGITLASMKAAVDDFVNTAQTKFPNATIHIGQLGRSRDNVNCLNRIITTNLPAMKQNTKAHYIAGCENLCHDYWRMSDTWHLTADYYKEIGIKIANGYDTYISVSRSLYEDTSKYVSTTVDSKFGSGSYIRYGCSQNDGLCTLFNGDIYLEGKTNIQCSGQQTISIKIGWHNGYETLFMGNGQSIIGGYGFFGLKASAGGTIYYHCLPFSISFKNTDGGIYLNFHNVYNQTTGYFTGYFWNARLSLFTTTIDALYV